MTQSLSRPLSLFLASSLLLLAGCASESTRPETAGGNKATAGAGKNEIVEKRALDRWQFLINHEAEKAYDYLSPGFRATKKREDYAREMNNRPARWTKALPYTQVCDKPDVCVLNLQIDADVKMPGVGKMVSSVGFVKETWIRTKGQWFMLPEAPTEAGRQ